MHDDNHDSAKSDLTATGTRWIADTTLDRRTFIKSTGILGTVVYAVRDPLR